jgi:hypothetical protein
MEYFIPRELTPHETSIQELTSSDIVILLISSNYGSKIEECQFKKTCQATCGMRDGSESISFTHCEYRKACYLGKPHVVYFVKDEGWEDKDVEKEKILSFKEEIEKTELRGSIRKKNTGDYDINQIFINLPIQIVRWYSEEKIYLKRFCGRREILKNWIDNGNLRKSVNVWGMGAIGKTTLCEVGLLLNKLKGTNIVYIGEERYHSSGTGYEFTSEAIKIHRASELSLKTITDACGIEYDSINVYSDLLYILDQNNGTILYIENYDGSNLEINELLKQGESLSRGCILVTSIQKLNSTFKHLLLHELRGNDAIRLVEVMIERFGESLEKKDILRIAELSEGHPLGVFVLVSLSSKISFNELNSIRNGFTSTDRHDYAEYINRVIERAITESQRSLLTILAHIDDEIEYDAFNEAYEEFHGITLAQNFGELIHFVYCTNNVILWRLNQVKDIIQYNITDDIKNHRFVSLYYKKLSLFHGENPYYSLRVYYHLSRGGLRYESLKLLESFLIHTKRIFDLPSNFLYFLSEISRFLINFEWQPQEFELIQVQELGIPLTNKEKRIQLLAIFVRTIGDIHSELMKRDHNVSKHRKKAIRYYNELLIKYYTPDSHLKDLYNDGLIRLVNVLTTHGLIFEPNEQREDILKAKGYIENALKRLDPVTDLNNYGKLIHSLANLNHSLAEISVDFNEKIELLVTAINYGEALINIQDFKSDHVNYVEINLSLGSFFNMIAELMLFVYLKSKKTLEKNISKILKYCGKGLRACHIAKSYSTIDLSNDSNYQVKIGQLYTTITQSLKTYNDIFPGSYRVQQVEKVCLKSINAFDTIRKNTDPTRNPVQFFLNQTNLALAYLLLIEIKKSNDDFYEYLNLLKDCRECFKTFPRKSLEIEYNIHIAYLKAAERSSSNEDRSLFYRKSIEVAEKALQEYSCHLNDLVWNRMKSNLEKYRLSGNVSGVSHSYSENDYF